MVGKYYVEFNKFENDNNQLIQLIIEIDMEKNTANIVSNNDFGYSVHPVQEETTGETTTEETDNSKVNFDIKEGDNIVYAYRSRDINDYEFVNYQDNDHIYITDNTTLLGIHLTSTVTTIGISAFQNCIVLTQVTIPSGVISIGVGTFENCIVLTQVTIPSGVISIGVGVFCNCDGLTKIIIPDSVTTMGISVFLNCVNLKEVVISNNIKTIDEQVFYGCEALEQIEIPNNVKTIKKNAFTDCIKLTKIIIPNTIETIDSTAFTNCNSINTIIITGCNEVNKVNNIITTRFNITETTYKFDKPDTANNTITFTKI